MGRCGLDSSGSDWGSVWRFCDKLMNRQVPKYDGNFLTNSATVIFSRRHLLRTISPVTVVSNWPKVKLGLSLKHNVQTYEVVEAELDKFLTPTKDRRDRSVSRPGRFTLGERTPGTHWIGMWARLKAGLDVADDNLLSLPGKETPRPSSSQPSRYTEIQRQCSITVCGTSCKSMKWLGCCQITRWM